MESNKIWLNLISSVTLSETLRDFLLVRYDARTMPMELT